MRLCKNGAFLCILRVFALFSAFLCVFSCQNGLQKSTNLRIIAQKMCKKRFYAIPPLVIPPFACHRVYPDMCVWGVPMYPVKSLSRDKGSGRYTMYPPFSPYRLLRAKGADALCICQSPCPERGTYQIHGHSLNTHRGKHRSWGRPIYVTECELARKLFQDNFYMQFSESQTNTWNAIFGN